MGASDKRNEGQSSSRERNRRLLVHDGFKDRAMTIRAKAISRLLASQDR